MGNESMSGQEIYDNFQQGRGTGGMSSSADLVNQLAARHHERGERLAALRTRMEAAWEGSAAEAANRGLGPAVSEHELSGTALTAAKGLTGKQAFMFDRTKNDVVPVPPEPGAIDPLVVLTNPEAVVSAMDQQTAHNEAAQHNVDAMNGYTQTSTAYTEQMPASYGQIVNDQAGIAVGDPSSGVVDSDDYRESTSDSGQQDSSAPGGSGEVAQSGPPYGENDGVGGPTGAPLPESGDSGATTPGGYTETTLPPGTTSLPPGADVGGPRPASGGPVSGIGVGIPLGGNGSVGGPGGGSPRGGVAGGPFRGAVGEPPGRSGSGVVTTGPGRGGVGFGGAPVGAGRGRGDEDIERKTPAYLEGGDPEELFDTDVLTAPSAIGENDD